MFTTDRFKISFYHVFNPKNLANYSNIKAITFCDITDKDSNQFLYLGRAMCKVQDQFSKNEGRKRSLTKAIKDLPKEVRTEIWRTYWEKRNFKYN